MNNELQYLNNISSSLKRINNNFLLLNLLNKAKSEFDKFEFQSAEEILTEALHITSDNPTVFRGLGCIEQFKRNNKKALEYFNKALDYSSSKEVEYTLIGVVYYLEDKYDEAIKYFDLAININDNYTDAYEWRNKALLENHVEILDLQERLKKYF